jgi:hypothetical protein
VFLSTVCLLLQQGQPQRTAGGNPRGVPSQGSGRALQQLGRAATEPAATAVCCPGRVRRLLGHKEGARDTQSAGMLHLWGLQDTLRHIAIDCTLYTSNREYNTAFYIEMMTLL